MERILNFITIVLISVGLPYFVQADIICGNEICHGNGAYCCDLDSGEEGCCWEMLIYEFWWFWVLWIAVFFLILACSGYYWRRRARNRRRVVMARSQYPTYGTVIRSSTGQTYGGMVNPVIAPGPPRYPQNPQNMQYPQNPPSYAAAPPSYAYAEATKSEKPPAYTA